MTVIRRNSILLAAFLAMACVAHGNHDLSVRIGNAIRGDSGFLVHSGESLYPALGIPEGRLLVR